MGVGYNPRIITNGLVLCLDAGNRRSYPGSGTTWTDLSGNGNNGTLTNGPTFSSSNGGQIVLDGTNDFIINSSTTNLPTGSSSRTIHVWINPSVSRGYAYNIFQLGLGGSGNQVYLFGFETAGSIFLFTDGINAGNNVTYSGSDLPTLGAWNHFTFGNSGQNWFYYLNGVSRLSGTWPTTINTNGQKYFIGNRDDVVTTPPLANYGQVSVYNRALTAAEIRQNFNATRGRYGI